MAKSKNDKKKDKKKKPAGYVFGRPPLYEGDKTIKKVEAYLRACTDEPVQYVKHQSSRGAKTFETRIRVRVPTIEGLAVHLRCTKPTIYDWAEKYPDFSYALEHLRAIQAARLAEGGLSGTYNPTISKLLLHGHGYADRLETDGTLKHKGNVSLSLSGLFEAAEKLETEQTPQ